MIDVFAADTDMFLDEGLFQAAYRQMSEFRREKIDRFRFDKDKRLSLGAGVLLDWGLRKLGLSEKDTVIALGEQEKPFLQDRPALRFNLSHSGHYAVCALSDEGDVGVDVEKIGRAEDALIRRVGTPKESARLLALPPMERNEQFFRLWTVKESFMKLLGTGLSLGPERLEAELDPTVSVRRDGAPQPVRFDQWRIAGHWITLCSTVSCGPGLTMLTRAELEERYQERA